MTGSTVSATTIEGAPWAPQDGPEPFLELWGIDPYEKWPRLFCKLVRLTALVRAYGSENPAQRAVHLCLRDAALSPMIFWARIKAALAPALEADRDTLAAFGLAPYARSVPALALALSLGLDAISVQDQEVEFLRRF